VQALSAALLARSEALDREAEEARASKDEDREEIAARADHFQRMVLGVDALRVLEEHAPPFRPDTFAIRVYVDNAKGRKFHLKVTDSKGKPVAGVQPVTVDDAGFATLTLSATDYPELAKAQPELTIQVTDGRGKEMFVLPGPVKFEPGRATVFSIAADSAPETKRRPPVKAKRKRS
jgi:hypothetical protein